MAALFAILNSVWRARQNKLVTTYGSARWATIKEIASAGLFKPKGVFLGRRQDGTRRFGSHNCSITSPSTYSVGSFYHLKRRSTASGATGFGESRHVSEYRTKSPVIMQTNHQCPRPSWRERQSACRFGRRREARVTAHYVATPWESHYGIRWMQNAFTPRERIQLFSSVAVMIINAAHPANEMAENALTDIARH